MASTEGGLFKAFLGELLGTRKGLAGDGRENIAGLFLRSSWWCFKGFQYHKYSFKKGTSGLKKALKTTLGTALSTQGGLVVSLRPC